MLLSPQKAHTSETSKDTLSTRNALTQSFLSTQWHKLSSTCLMKETLATNSRSCGNLDPVAYRVATPMPTTVYSLHSFVVEGFDISIHGNIPKRENSWNDAANYGNELVCITNAPASRVYQSDRVQRSQSEQLDFERPENSVSRRPRQSQTRRRF